MNVLGINPSIGVGHDTGAAIIKDNKLVAAVEEERFTRRKHEIRPPVNSIEYCLREAKLSLDDIDYIAVTFSPSLVNKRNYLSFPRKLRATLWHFLSFMPENASSDFISLAHTLGRRKELHKKLGNSGLAYKLNYQKYLSGALDKNKKVPKIDYIEHHRCHAATAYYCSGFEEASVITIDGAGERNSTVAWHGKNSGMRKIREESIYNSFGFLYTDVTNFLNLGEAAEGKTMGLAPYGKPDAETERMFKKNLLSVNGSTWYNVKYSQPSPLTASQIGFPPRTTEQPTSERYADLAYTLQDRLEKTMKKIAQYTINRTGSPNVCLAGGVALNCSANGAIRESGFVDDLYIFPAAHDGGTPVGAALACAAKHGSPVNLRMEHAYWGPGYSDEEIQKTLEQYKISYEIQDNIGKAAAEEVANGKVLSWFQGRTEIGPRALGARSIIGDPRTEKMRDLLNEVKLREKWRPLAPSLLDSAKEEYLENACDSPFMILAFQVQKNKRREIAAVTHVDYSTRPQTVKREINERYWKLIKGFEQETGTPVVVNTSFNVGPEAIVCSPRDAIRTFFASKIDTMAIGNCLVRK